MVTFGACPLRCRCGEPMGFVPCNETTTVRHTIENLDAALAQHAPSCVLRGHVDTMPLVIHKDREPAHSAVVFPRSEGASRTTPTGVHIAAITGS